MSLGFYAVGCIAPATPILPHPRCGQDQHCCEQDPSYCRCTVRDNMIFTAASLTLLPGLGYYHSASACGVLITNPSTAAAASCCLPPSTSFSSSSPLSQTPMVIAPVPGVLRGLLQALFAGGEWRLPARRRIGCGPAAGPWQHRILDLVIYLKPGRISG